MARKTKMNKITSAEKTALINKNNLQLKNEFLSYLRSVGRSQGTINGYDNDLLIVFTYVMENLNNKDFSTLTKRDRLSLQGWLVSNGNSSARIRRIKSSISSLSNYCENILAGDDPEFDDYHSIVRKIENPPLAATREKTVWETDELERLLQCLVDKKKFEQACFVALGMYGGRRKSEICRFKVSDFDDNHLVFGGAMYKSSPILTKGNKYLECYTLAKRFKPYLDMWIDYRTENGIVSEWLFPAKDDPKEHIQITTLNSWTKTFSNITNNDFYFHSLRHYFVSDLSKAGIPDSAVVTIIGWSSADMFNIYNDNSKDDQLAQFFKDGDIFVPEKTSFADIQ